MAQGFTRLCAVHRGIYALRTNATHLIADQVGNCKAWCFFYPWKAPMNERALILFFGNMFKEHPIGRTVSYHPKPLTNY